MKKSLVAMLLFISGNQMLACDYYEDEKVLKEVIETGTYKSKDTTGKLCSNDKRQVIPIKKGKVEGLAKTYYKSGALEVEINFKNGKAEGLGKMYYKSGALKGEANFKNGELEGLWKQYYESGALEIERKFKNSKEEGLEKWYYESGELKIETKYKNGKEEWTKFYDRFGNVEYERK